MKKETFIPVTMRILGFIGLVIGVVIGTLVGWNTLPSVALGLIIAFVFVYLFSLRYRKEIKELNKPFEPKKK